MSSLEIPSTGLVLKPHNGDNSKSGLGLPEAFSLTLADSVIEDMIKCVKNGNKIQLSFGRNPTLLYGSKAQHLLVSNEDPFTTELYRTEFDSDETTENEISPSQFVTRPNKRHLVPTQRRTTAKSANLAAAEPVDAAIEALKAGMSEELSKKSASAPLVQSRQTATLKKGAAKAATPRFLSQNKKGLASDASRSTPVSPALSGVGSPSLGSTSVPLSQQKAEKDKEVRSWIIHYLAVDKAKEEDIWSFFSSRTDYDKDEFKTALGKVADYESGSQTWVLRSNRFKEMDPWAFEYASQEDRQQAIEHTIKAYDKMRLHVSEPEWQKLLPESERNQGKVLSKLTAKIAEKSSASKVPGHDTETDEERLLGDGLTVKGGGEPMSRSASSSSTTKTKKVSEKEAQAKRLLGKPGKAKATGKASPATKMSPAKKPATKKEKEESSRIKSSQFVNESDDEDDFLLLDATKPVATSVATAIAPKSAAPKSAAPKTVAPKTAGPKIIAPKSGPPKIIPPKSASAAKPTAKRARAEDTTETKAALPAVKNARRDDGASTPLVNGHTSLHRASDASQNSQNSASSRSTAPSTIKTKNSSPHKSSPLASSPPTNASDPEEEYPYQTSSSASPYTSSLKRKATELSNARAGKKPATGIRPKQAPPKPGSSTSVSPASTNDITRVVSEEVIELAERFKTAYAKYVRLHKQLEDTLNPSDEDIQHLNSMHTKLQQMKDDIFEAVS